VCVCVCACTRISAHTPTSVTLLLLCCQFHIPTDDLINNMPRLYEIGPMFLAYPLICEVCYLMILSASEIILH